MIKVYYIDTNLIFFTIGNLVLYGFMALFSAVVFDMRLERRRGDGVAVSPVPSLRDENGPMRSVIWSNVGA